MWTKHDEREDKARVARVAEDEANRLWEEALLSQSAPGATNGGNNKTADQSAAAVNVQELMNAGVQDNKGTTGRSRWLRLLKKR